jgi:hypothetical protein
MAIGEREHAGDQGISPLLLSIDPPPITVANCGKLQLCC